MLMKWEDLEPGDTIKVTNMAKVMFRNAWFKDIFNKILIVKKILIFDESNNLTPALRIFFANHRDEIYIELDGKIYRGDKSVRREREPTFFEIVGLKED